LYTKKKRRRKKKRRPFEKEMRNWRLKIKVLLRPEVKMAMKFIPSIVPTWKLYELQRWECQYGFLI
jgi:hypothetical protein